MKSSSMPVFNKLNLGEHAEIAVFNAAKSFVLELSRLKNVKVLRDPKKPKALAGTSKRFNCEFNRDSGWRVIREAGFESVRMVAIDEDCSALRFRRLQYVNRSR